MSNDAKTPPSRRPELVAQGLYIDDRVIPLLAGSVHYYHLEVEHWRPALEQLRDLGLNFVDTYVPWSVHEQSDGSYDFGHTNPRLDVAAFLRLADELGLFAIVRPGPHVNGELTRFGIPERVIWDEACMARSSSGAPIVLTVLPLAFPVPSYASRKFLNEVERWYQQVGHALGELAYPHGPIVMLQVDNEAVQSFRDGVFDQDYHEDAISAYRQFLAQRHESLETARRLHKNPVLNFAKARPASAKSWQHLSDLPAALDWAESQEVSVSQAIANMASQLKQHFPSALLSHNLPPGWELSVLDPARLEACVDLVGADYYHRATPRQRLAIFERTSELRTRASARNQPCFAAELGVGFPPYFTPHTEFDSRFTALCALAYGVQAFNLYMAVERDRWIGAPLGIDGTPRDEAPFYRKLVEAVLRTRLNELLPLYSVSVVVPRQLRRLSRVLHAFDPLSPTLLSAMTGNPALGPTEQNLGLPSSLVIDCWEFLSLLHNALDGERIPYRVVSGDQFTSCHESSRWTVVLSCSAMPDAEFEVIQRAMADQQTVTLAPHFPGRNEYFEPVASRSMSIAAEAEIPALLGVNQSAINQAVQNAKQRLCLASFELQGEGVHATLFSTASGEKRVAFLINPTERRMSVSWRLAGVQAASDALTGDQVAVNGDRLELSVAEKSVSMLELVPVP